MATGKDTTTSDSTTVATTTPRLNAEQLRNIESFQDALNLVQSELGGTVVSAEDLGDGFSLQEDKDPLIGRPLMFVGWNFSEGDFGPFVSARVLVQYPGNEKPEKVVINDGSTGIYQQLLDLSERNSNGVQVLMVPRGLRKSEYTYTDEKGKERPAQTYYIDTSARSK